MAICNEIEVIKFFSSLNTSLPEGVVGIGDDCAVIPMGGSDNMVVTTDTLTEGTHFLLDKASPKMLANKSLASNISDVIAMGATPTFAFLSITLGKCCDSEWVKSFAEGFGALAAKHGIMLIGGDTTRSSLAVTITITLMGRVSSEHIKMRSGAKPGDVICCLNPLGGSAMGLNMLCFGVEEHPLIELHYTPRLYVDEAVWLARFAEVHAMMDISDGIAKDLSHILDSSKVGAFIDTDTLPIEEIVLSEARNYGVNATSLALEGGEEYSPLFTVKAEFFEELSDLYKERFGGEIYAIGAISSDIAIGEIEWRRCGIKEDISYRGYHHDGC